MLPESKAVGANEASGQPEQPGRPRAGSASVGGQTVDVVVGLRPDGDIDVASRLLQDAPQPGAGPAVPQAPKGRSKSVSNPNDDGGGHDVKEDFSVWLARQRGSGDDLGPQLQKLPRDGSDDEPSDDGKLEIEPKRANKSGIGDAVPRLRDDEDGPAILRRDSLVDRVQATNSRWKQAGAATGGGLGQGLVGGAVGGVVGVAAALTAGKLGAALGATAFSWSGIGIPVGAVLGFGIGAAIGFGIGVYRGTRAGFTYADKKFWSPQKLHLEHAILKSRERIGEYSAEEKNRLAAVTDEQWRKLLSIGTAREWIKNRDNRQLIREAVVRRVATTDFHRALMLKQDLMRRAAMREDPSMVRTAFCEDAFPRSERDAMIKRLGLERDRTLPPDIDQKIDDLILSDEQGELETRIEARIEALLLEEAQEIACTKGDRERAMHALGLDRNRDLPGDIDAQINRLVVQHFRDNHGRGDLEKEVSALLVEQAATQAAGGNDVERHNAAAGAFGLHAARYSESVEALMVAEHPGSSQLRKILLKYGGGPIADKVKEIKNTIAQGPAASLETEQGREQARQNLHTTMTAIVGPDMVNLEHAVQDVPAGVRDVLRPIGQAVVEEVARSPVAAEDDVAPETAVTAAMYNVFLLHGLCNDLVADDEQARTPEQLASLELNRRLVLSILEGGMFDSQADETARLKQEVVSWEGQTMVFLARLGGVRLDAWR